MSAKLPTFDELPNYKDRTGCAWGVWPEDDELGTVNLLTPELVAQTAKEEIRSGRTISLNWPINFPEHPMFHRKTPEIEQVAWSENVSALRDDTMNINTQSGTQWDGLRHFGILAHGVYYKGIRAETLPAGRHPMPDPNNIDPKLTKLGIQNWAKHGIVGRGVLLDVVSYYEQLEGKLPYDPFTTHSISVDVLKKVAEHQGTTFRAGDILLLRVGFIKKYMDQASPEDRQALGSKPETFAGIERSEDMKRFLWDNHFAAVASDQPALEAWPSPDPTTEPYLHETILGLWGMPIGEFFDLEELSKHCAETNRYAFYFSAWPLPIIGGCASPGNASATF